MENLSHLPPASKIESWALTLPPKTLALQLTAHAGTNVLHKEELSLFLKRPRTAKAMFFTTSPKGDPPALVTALAVYFRQRLLVGEVKASDMTLRKAFSENGVAISPPGLIVTDREGKRHKFKGGGKKWKRDEIVAFLEKFALDAADAEMHRAVKPVGVEHVKVGCASSRWAWNTSRYASVEHPCQGQGRMDRAVAWSTPTHIRGCADRLFRRSG